MADGLRLREAALEWAARAAAGELEGLDWAEPDLSPTAPPFSELEDEPGRFRHLPYGAFLPPPMVQAAREAQGEGMAVTLEAVMLAFARPEWLIHTRRLLWTPLSPAPDLLAALAEIYGVGAELHRGDRGRLARLAARLPGWHPHRGRLDRAMALLEDALETPLSAEAAHADTAGPEPDFPPLRSEAFACRSADWWRRRQTPGAKPAYRITGGVVRFQPDEGPRWPLIREDVLIGWAVGRPFPHSALRLLPAWQVVRLVVKAPEKAT